MNPIKYGEFVKPRTHLCKQKYYKTVDREEDYIDLVNWVQRHVRSSSDYCLQENKKILQSVPLTFPLTVVIIHIYLNTIKNKNNCAKVVTERNDARVNHNISFRVELQIAIFNS